MKSTVVLMYRQTPALLFCGLSMVAASLGPAPARAADAAAADTDSGGLEEIVVTATKQADTINRVPISMAAVTQKTLDQEGVKTIADLARTIPALQLISGTSVDRTPNIAIRGIYSSTGAQTTAVYLDDTPLQKRNALSTITGGGTPIPVLFDLERVEVLRGPQGTLFGGSAEGGAVRFITPTPSLTQYSGYVRAESSFTEDGAPSYEGGVAVGGPIVANLIGFRASVFARQTGGYIDHVDRYTGDDIANNTNSSNDVSARVALLFAPLENLTITPALYMSKDNSHDSDSYWQNIPQVTAPGLTTGAHVYPSYTYGPYNVYGPYKSGLNCNIGANYASTLTPCAELQPKTSTLSVPTLSAEYDLGAVAVKSITSYLDDKTWGHGSYSYTTLTNPATGGVPFDADLPQFFSPVSYANTRHGYTEELRFSSAAAARPVSWVGGLYYSDFAQHSTYLAQGNLDPLIQSVYGLPVSAIYGVPVEANDVIQHRDQHLEDKEAAAFGELNYYLTSQLKFIGGVRVSRTEFEYSQAAAGTLSGFLVPTFANGGLTQGDVVEKPVTPRMGLQYLIDDHDSVYATAAKGFRAGGVNQPPPGARCAADLALLGETTTPGTYKSDSLWSYEIGAKVRPVGDRVQINASAYYIDWSDVQVNYALPTCGFGYTINGGKAASRGGDLQTEIRLIDRLTLNAQVAYTNAEYTDAVTGPAPTRAKFINDGDPLPTPKWTSNIGMQYTLPMGRYEPYVRADYQYQGSHVQGFGPGTSSYTPDTYWIGSADYVSARAGLYFAGLDLSLFANNLFNSQPVLSSTGGRSGCSAASGASCSVYRQYDPVFVDTTFQPRTVGLTIDYRF